MNIHKRQLAGQARGAGGHVMSRSECGCEMRVGVEPASVRRRRRAHVLALVALLLLLMVPGDADALGPNWDSQARPDAQERSVRSRKLDLDGTEGMEVKLKDFLKGVPWAAAPASSEGNGTVTDVPVVSVVSPGNVTSQAGSLEMNETLFASIRDCDDLPVASLRDCIASIFEGSPYSNLTNVLDFILDAAFLNDTEGGGGDSFRIDEAQDQDQVQAAGDGAAVPQGSSGSAATIAVTVTVTTVVLAAIGAVGLAIALRRRKEGSGGASPAAGALVHQGSASKIGLDLNMSGEDVELDEVVGRGAFGVVYRATWRGRQVAVKSIAPGHPGEKHLRAFRKEVEVLSKLDHENIVVMFGACCSPSPGGGVFLVEEFVSRGSLHDRIHAREDKMETEEIVRLGLEIARALAYLHPRIVHVSDVHPSPYLSLSLVFEPKSDSQTLFSSSF